MRVSARTVAYTVFFALLMAAVVWLLSKIARTEVADRRLITIGAAVVLGAVVLLAGFLFRSRRQSSDG